MSHAEFVDWIGPSADIIALNPASGKRRVNTVVIGRTEVQDEKEAFFVKLLMR
ncbi:hypothetical protein D3C80_2063580 [compost metagenome]